MSKLVLFWSIGSQPGRAVKTLLELGNIPHDSHRVNVGKLQHKSKEYLKINPLGLIPAIKDGDFTLGESNAILTYLCERYPQIAHYHGKDLYERATVNQYLSWYQNNFRLALFRPFRKFLSCSVWGATLNQDEILLQWRQMWECIQKFEQILAINRTKYIAGDTLSIADLLYFYEMSNLGYFKVGHEKYPHVAEWYKRVSIIEPVAMIMKEWGVLAAQRAEAFEKIFPIRLRTVE